MVVLCKKEAFVLLVVLLQMHLSECNEKKKKPRIAIIGGGIGGTVTAYELSKLGRRYDLDFTLDLYEEAKIGGRLATTKINGFEFETGGSAIHEGNVYMTEYVDSLRLFWKTQLVGHGHDSLHNHGFHNGKQFVLLTSKSPMWRFLDLMRRYGFNILNLGFSEILKTIMFDFKRIYGLQRHEIVFDNVHVLLAVMNSDFPDLMKITLKDYFKSQGYSDYFIEEFIFVHTNAIFNQNTSIPAFVGSLSLAEAQSGAFRSVEGGNKRLPEWLFDLSFADLIKARVESITLTQDLKYALAVGNASRIYDYVVVACPLIENSEKNLKFENFPDLNIPRIKYQKIVVTLVHGELNHTFFNVDSPEKLPRHIYSVNDELFYNSISVITPVMFDEEYDNAVFKVLSKEVLTEEQLDLIFATRDTVKVFQWLAYPLYDTLGRDLQFEPRENLFYINAIEWASSSMEMTAISAVNIVLRIIRRLK